MSVCLRQFLSFSLSLSLPFSPYLSIYLSQSVSIYLSTYTFYFDVNTPLKIRREELQVDNTVGDHNFWSIKTYKSTVLVVLNFRRVENVDFLCVSLTFDVDATVYTNSSGYTININHYQVFEKKEKTTPGADIIESPTVFTLSFSSSWLRSPV